MADITERIVIPEVPRVLDGQELYVYIPERNVNYYTKEETDALLATKFDKSNVSQTTGDSTVKVMSQKAATDIIEKVKCNSIISVNLFNKEEAIQGKYFGDNGTLLDNANSYYIDNYIEIDNTKRYFCSSAYDRVSYQIATYNDSKIFIERINIISGDSGAVTFGSTVKFVRISVYNSNFDNFFFSDTISEYEPYNLCVNGSNILKDSIEASSITKKAIYDIIGNTSGKTVLTKENYYGYIDMGDGYYGSAGEFNSSPNYHTKNIVLYNNIEIWLDTIPTDYLSLAIFDTKNPTRKSFNARYRTGDNNLPTFENKLSLKKGQCIGITYAKTLIDFEIQTSGLIIEYVFNNGILLNSEQSKIIKLTKISDNEYEIYMNGYIIPWVHRVREDIRANQWNISKNITKNGVVVCPEGTDIIGVLQEVGEADFMGGIHGDETVVTMKMYADGKEVSDTVFCKSLDIIMQSHLTRVSTGDNIIDRFVHLNFKDDKLTIETTFKCLVDNFSLSYAYNGGMFAWFKEQGNFMFLNDRFYDVENPVNVNANTLQSITVALNDNIQFSIENKIGNNNENYQGRIVYYSGETVPRIKVYYATDHDTTWSNGHICYGKTVYTLR